MQQTYSVQHNEHVTSRSYDEVIQAFEAATGSVEGGTWPHLAASAKTVEEFEALVRSHEGTSGFMRFLTIDHSWMARYGSKARCRMYTLGNPLIAKTMLTHAIAGGLNVPIRLAIYEDLAGSTTHLAYDLPSSLMSVLKNDDLSAAANELDEKLLALALQVTGSAA